MLKPIYSDRMKQGRSRSKPPRIKLMGEGKGGGCVWWREEKERGKGKLEKGKFIWLKIEKNEIKILKNTKNQDFLDSTFY